MNTQARGKKSKLKTTVSTVLKAVLTLLAFYLLLSHKVQMVDSRTISLSDGGTVVLKPGDVIVIDQHRMNLHNGKEARSTDRESISLKDGMHVQTSDGRHGTLQPLHTKTTFSAIRDFLPQINAREFWMFVLLAALIKMIGILSSMYRWHLLIQGQGIRLPFWHIMGSFLIGRFLGTFLPSTIGLDGYKLYDAARFSRRTVEVTAATVIEKVLGIVGIFITYLVAIPFGISVLGDKAVQIGLLTVPAAAFIIVVFFLLLFYPGLIQFIIEHLPIPGKARIQNFIHKVANAASAYKNKKMLLFNAAFQSFSVHFCTAAMYFFTALAIGAVGATFWQVTFASTIQIFATVMSPVTIAGEGIREIAQYYLLRNQLGPAQSIVSAALGFWAAEALTLFGGVFWWIRKKDYRPSFLYLDGRKVDIEAIMAEPILAGGGTLAPSSRPPVPKKWSHILTRTLSGFSGGLFAGVLIGLAEAFWIHSVKGATPDLFPYAVILYGLIGAVTGTGLGIVTGILSCFLRLPARSAWTLPLIASFWVFVNIFIVGRFRMFRDIFKEQALPMTTQLGLLLGSMAAGLILLILLKSIAGRIRRFNLCVLLSALTIALILAIIPAIHGISTGKAPTPVPAAPDALAGKPNVIIIMTDALRADRLSCYGYTRSRSPILDQMASEGVRFHEAYSNSSWTKPGTANIFTGLFPSGHKTYLKPDVLPDPVVTIAEVFHEAGYYTAGFPNNINIAPTFNFGQGFNEYTYLAPDYFFLATESSSQLSFYSILRLIRERYIVRSKYPRHYYQEADVVNRHLYDFLDRCSEASRFLLYVHYMDPHDPYFHHPFNGVGYARVDMPNPPASMAPIMSDAYDAEVNYMDGKIGELIAKLKAKNLWENTIVLIVADHGEEFYEHGGWWHGTTLYEEQIRVPMIFKLTPAMSIHNGIRIDKTSHVDIAPTLISLCGLNIPDSMNQGRNLFGPIAPESQNRDIFAEEDHEGNILHSLIKGPWKIITANPGNPRGLQEKEMYRLDIDLKEKDNLADSQTDKLREMESDLNRKKEEAADTSVTRQSKDLDAAELEKMKNLGYVIE